MSALARGGRRRLLRHVAIYAGLTPFLVIALFPILWMTITAFKHERDLYQMKFPLWFHLPPTVKHFHLLFAQTWLTHPPRQRYVFAHSARLPEEIP